MTVDNVSKYLTGCWSVKIFVTFTLCLAYLGLGMCIGIHGPTLTALSENINSTVVDTSSIFTARSVGYLAGSMLAGVLFDRLNRFFVLGVALLLSSVSLALVPWGKTLWLLNSFILFQGLGMGFMDTGGNVICIEVWGPKNSWSLQTLHFFFGLGSFVAPNLAQPFLKSETKQSTSKNHLSSSISNQTSTNQFDEFDERSCSALSGFEEFFCSCSIKCPYLANALLVAVVGMTSFALGCRNINLKQRKDSNLESDEKPKFRAPRTLEIILLFLLSLFFFCYVGSEVTYGGLVSSFTEFTFGVSQRLSANLASIFWGLFSIGRFAGIFVSRVISPMKMILCDLIISLIAWIILVSTKFINQGSFVALCVSSGLLGFGMSWIFPSGIAWVSTYLHLSGKYASIFVVGSAFGEMVLPIAGAHMMDVNLYYMIYFLTAVNILCGVLIFMMWIVADKISNSGEIYSEIFDDDFARRENLSDEETGDHNELASTQKQTKGEVESNKDASTQ